MEGPRIYSPKYYDRIQELEERHWWYIGMRAVAASLLRSHSAGGGRPRVLDAGCGTGATMAWARAALGAGDVTGIDVAREALELCVARGERRLLRSSVMQLPFRDACFDLVLCCDVLQHLPTDGGDLQALRELRRVLCAGGAVLIRTNSRLGAIRRGVRADPDFQQYRVEEVVSRMEAAGFAVTRRSYANALPALYAVVRAWFARREKSPAAHDHGLYRGLAVRDTAVRRPWLNRLLLSILAGEARYLAVPHRRLRFGHTIMCVGVKPHEP
jgi:SAM-dependent methyltransferase